MGTKLNPGNFDCYAAALPDEPLFVLLGRDALAPQRVLDWADQMELQILRGAVGDKRNVVKELLKLAEARRVSEQMISWRRSNAGIWRLPAVAMEVDQPSLPTLERAIDIEGALQQVVGYLVP